MSLAGAIRAGRAFVEIGANDGPLQQAMARVRARLNGMAAGLARVGGGLLAAGGGVLGSLAWPLQLAANLEQSQAKFETLLGSAGRATQMLNDIRQMAAATPFETSDLVGATETLLSFGVEADQVIGIMQQLGDASGGNAERFRSLALVFGQVSANGRLTGGDLLQMINAGFNPLQNIAERTGESMTELRDRMSDGRIGIDEVKQAFADATGPGGRFFGLMDKQSQTLTGRFSTLRDSLAEALRPLGEALLPIVGSLVQHLTTLLNVVGGWISENRSLAVVIAGVGASLVVLGGVLTGTAAGIYAITLAGGVLATTLGTLTALVSSPWVLAGAAIVALLGYLGTLQTALGAVSEWFMQFAPTALTAWAGVRDAIASGDLSAAFNIATLGMQVIWLELMEQLRQAWASFTNPIRDVWNNVTTGIVKIGASAFYTILSVWETVTTGLQMAFDGVATYIVGTIDVIGTKIAQLFASAEEAQQMQRELEQRAAGRQSGLDTANEGRARESQARLDAINDQAANYFATLDQMAEEEQRARRNSQNSALDAARRRLAEEQDKLKAAVEEQAAKREQTAEEDNLAKKIDDAATAAERVRGSSSLGTFNVATAAQQLGLGRDEETRRQQRRTADNTQRLVDLGEQGNLVFG